MIPITPQNLELIGFRTTGQCTRKKVSYYLELCFMHHDGSMRLQTIGSGFSEPLSVSCMEDVTGFINQFKKVIVFK